MSVGHALKYEGKTKILRSHSITECCSARPLNETVFQKKTVDDPQSNCQNSYTRGQPRAVHIEMQRYTQKA